MKTNIREVKKDDILNVNNFTGKGYKWAIKILQPYNEDTGLIKIQHLMNGKEEQIASINEKDFDWLVNYE